MIKKIIKKVGIVLLVAIILSNFITANYVYSDDDDEDELDYGVVDEIYDKIDKDKFIEDEDAGKNADGDAINNFGRDDNEFENEINEMINIFGQKDEEVGAEGVLFTPITQFLLAISDAVMATMQGAFMGSGNTIGNLTQAGEIKIKSPGGSTLREGITRYSLRYTPAAIFSGDIPAFDTNFFEPMGDADGKVKFNDVEISFNSKDDNITYEDCISSYGANTGLKSVKDKLTTGEAVSAGLSLVCLINALEAVANTDLDVDWAEYGAGVEAVTFGGEFTASVPMFEFDVAGAATTAMFLVGAAGSMATYGALEAKDADIYFSEWKSGGETYFFIADTYFDTDKPAELSGRLYKIEEKTVTGKYEKVSAAFTLQPVVSKWYTQLRKIALVGLLSVLVYVGIRIIFSSTSQEKAKYKKMLVDWAGAVCILFVLHYIMVFIVEITGSLVDILGVNGNLSDGTDVFATKIRNMATGDAAASYMQYFGYVVIYIALTILTVIFTIQYTKRLILLAFLTMIAPLIALTYPIDKINDGKAQAFSYWIKEYIFNSLLQPMHLLLYTIFISSATEIMDVNPVYAVVVMSFFVSAEQIFRRIFGFDKASTVNALGAAAGGAMVMNMINKMRGNSRGKGTVDGKGTQNKIRMAPGNIGNNSVSDSRNNEGSETSKNDIETNSGNGEGKSSASLAINRNSEDATTDFRTGKTSNRVLGRSRYTGNGEGKSSASLVTKNNSGRTLENSTGSGNDLSNKSKGIKRKANVKQGLKQVGKGLAIRGAKGALSAGKKVIKRTPGAIAGATVGIAATVASGGENPLSYIGGGAVAGAAITDNATEKVSDVAKKGTEKVAEDYNKGAKKLTPKQEKILSEYKKMLGDTKIQSVCKKNGVEVKDSIISFINKGIEDPVKIRTALENGITNPDDLDKK